jgi:HEAT repeat protein
MDDLIRSHRILAKMGRHEKLNLIRSLVGNSDKPDLGLLFELLGDPNYEFRRVAYTQLETLGDKILEETLEQVRIGNGDQKYWCVRLLTAMGSLAASALELCLSEEDSTLQFMAISALSELESPSSILPLVRLFSVGPWSVRQAAFEALEGFGEQVLPVLKDQLESTEQDSIYWSIRLLGKLGFKGRKLLLEQFHKANQEMKFVVASALGESGDRKILSLLVKCFQGESWSQKKRAFEALVRVGQPSIPPLLQGMKKLKPQDFFWYASSLAKIGNSGEAALAEFIEACEEDWLWDAREELSKLGDSLIPVLELLLKSAKRSVRFFALQLAADLESPLVLNLLVSGLRDAEWVCKKLCADSLVFHGDVAVEALRLRLGSATEDERYWCIQVLGRTDSGRSLIVDVLREDNKSIVAFAAEALRGQVPAEAILPLLNCLKSVHWVVRNQASETLISAGILGLEKVVETLSDEDEELRFWISKILKSYPQSTYSFLISLFYRKTFLRHLAALAMGIMGHKSFVSPLQEGLKDPDSVLVLYSTQALSKILPDEEILSTWGLLSILDIGRYPLLEDLVRTYRESAPDYILHGMASADSILVHNCIYLAGTLEIVEAIPGLERLLLSDDLESALLCANAFMHLRYQGALPLIERVLDQDIPDSLRLKLLSLVGVLSENAVIPLILKLIEGAPTDSQRRSCFLEVLRMGPPAIPKLMEALGFRDIPLRRISAEVLVEFGSLAVPHLTEGLEEGNANKKFWIQKILKAIHEPRSL